MFLMRQEKDCEITDILTKYRVKNYREYKTSKDFINGDIAVRKLMNLTLAVDHKVANGVYAAEFLDFVRKVLEDASSFV